MGEHKLRFKGTFEMHGYVHEFDTRVNAYPEWPDQIRIALEMAIERAMMKYWDEEADAQIEKAELERAKKEQKERALLAELKAKYEGNQ